MKLLYFVILVTTAFADSLVPITITCNECTEMLPTATTNLNLKYYNPSSALPPFPYLSEFEFLVVNPKTSQTFSQKRFTWNNTQTDLVIPFRPDQWNVEGAASIAIKINWQEKFYDKSLGGYGSQTLLYINVNPYGSNGTLVIGSNSVAIGCGLSFWLIALFLLL